MAEKRAVWGFIWAAVGFVVGGVVAPTVTLIGEYWLRNYVAESIGPKLEFDFAGTEGKNIRVTVHNDGAASADVFRIDACRPKHFLILRQGPQYAVLHSPTSPDYALEAVMSRIPFPDYFIQCEPFSETQSLSLIDDNPVVELGKPRTLLFTPPVGFRIASDTGNNMASGNLCGFTLAAKGVTVSKTAICVVDEPPAGTGATGSAGTAAPPQAPVPAATHKKRK